MMNENRDFGGDMKNTMRMIGVLLCCGITGLMVQSALGTTFTNGTWFKVTLTPPDPNDTGSYCNPDSNCVDVADGDTFSYKSSTSSVVFNVMCGSGGTDCSPYDYIGTVAWDKDKKTCTSQDGALIPNCSFKCGDDKTIYLKC